MQWLQIGIRDIFLDKTMKNMNRKPAYQLLR
jgi:hypothetical protein